MKSRVNIDQFWARDLEGFLNTQLSEMPLPGEITNQVEGILFAGYLQDMGMISYAQGASLKEVQHTFRKSVAFYLEVFRFHGTISSYPDQDPEESSSDHSLTNSRRALQAMELALACEPTDIAVSLASFVWDPPHASYLGADSVVCTPQEQQLAYMLRDLLRNYTGTGGTSIKTLKPETVEQAHRLALLKALFKKDQTAFEAGLIDLHDSFLCKVGKKELLSTLDDLLDIPTLAYAMLGNSVFTRLRGVAPDRFLPLMWREGFE